MLTITIPGDELWDDEAEVFRYTEDTVLQFEHSLVSLSKWESKHHKLFLSNKDMTEEETASYIEAMLVTPNVAPDFLSRFSAEDFEAINAYINDPMTGTTFSNLPQNQGKTIERISAELIYFWMSQYQIDKECETWHLNRLFTLIRVHHAKTQKPQKMSKQARVQQMAEANARRKAQLGTSG